MVQKVYKKTKISRSLRKLRESVAAAMVEYDVNRNGTLEVGEFITMVAFSPVLWV